MRLVRKLPTVIYRWAVIFLAFWFASYLFPFLDFDLTGHMFFMVALGIVAEGAAVSFPQGQIAATFAVIFASYLIFGPAGAVWITALGCLLGQILARGNSLSTLLFNASQYIVAIAGADFLYMYLGGSPEQRLAWENVLPLMAFVIACYAINQLLIYIYLLPERKNNPLVFWRDAMRWDGLTYLLTAPFGALMAVIYNNVGLWGVLLLFLPVLVMQFVLRMYVHLELANRELRALYEVAKGLEGNLDQDAILKVVLREARRVVKYHTGIIYLWCEKKGCYEAKAVEGPYTRQLQNSIIIPGQEFLGCLAQSGERAIVCDSKRDPRVSGQPGFTQVHKSLLVLPLLTEKEVLGLFVLGDKRRFAFHENHLHIFTGIVGQAAVAVANARLNNYLETGSKTDTLTGLYNRRHFLNYLGNEFTGETPPGQMALILIDIDHLSRINHTYGHDAGDAVISMVGRSVSAVVGYRGVVARFDGEQLAVLLPGAGELLAAEYAESIRKSVNSTVLESGDNRYKVGVSCGVACCPQDAADAEGLLRKADQALRGAKGKGRNCIQVYSTTPSPGIKQIQ
jgi:diguanylate cyclase (GGDEF)-like protein